MSYRLARSVAPNDTLIWLSTPSSDIAVLTRLVSEAETRLLRAALDHGRASPEYTVANAAYLAVEADLALAVSRVDPTVGAIVDDVVFQIDSEYVVVRFTSGDVVEVGRAAYGSARATHAAGVDVYVVKLRVVATIDVELLIEGQPVSAGDKGDVALPDLPGRITSVRLIADQPGNLVLDLRRAAFPSIPTVSITGATPPTLAGTQTYSDSALVGWTTAFTSGDVMRFVVLSASSVTRVTAVVTCTTAI